MRRRWMVHAAGALAAFLLAPTVAGAAPATLLWAVEGGVSTGWGLAAYDLESEVGPDTLMSRLEFPLDHRSVTGRLSCSLRRAGRERWRFALVGEAGISDPSALMRDYDWIEPSGYPRIPFSYTESQAEAVSFTGGVNAHRPLVQRGAFQLYLSAGYRFDYELQSIRGYKGWQYVWNPSAGAYDLYLIWSSSEALRYTLYSHAVPIGAGVRLGSGKRTGLDLEAALAPLYVADVDDHLLRHKLSTASGPGFGGSLVLRAWLLLSSRGDRTGPFLSLEASAFTFHVSTTQVQEWYGDDPSAPGDETGMVISGIGHVISGWQVRTALTLGFRF